MFIIKSVVLQSCSYLLKSCRVEKKSSLLVQGEISNTEKKPGEERSNTFETKSKPQILFVPSFSANKTS